MEKTSLKNILFNYIKFRGEITSYEAERLAKEHNYKISNMERRMRECSGIEKIYNERGVITGYRYIKPEVKGQLALI